MQQKIEEIINDQNGVLLKFSDGVQLKITPHVGRIHFTFCSTQGLKAQIYEGHQDRLNLPNYLDLTYKVSH